MTVDAHTPGIIVPKSQPFQYNFGLIGNVLESKQLQFDTAYSGLQKLRRESLDIQFMNKKEQGKVDAFNQKINSFFDGISDLGDLSNSNLTTRYTALFNEIGKDTNLINRYRTDQKYRTELEAVQEKKNSDNPRKAGYDDMNYDNYLYSLGNYANADLDKQDVAVDSYVNFTDINKGQLDSIKQVPILQFRRDKQLGNGYIERHDYKGRDKQAVSLASKQYLQSDGAAQLAEQAKYHFRHSVTTPEDYQYLYGEHQSRINNGVVNLEATIQAKRDDMVGLIGQDLIQATNEVEQLSQSLIGLQSQQMTQQEFLDQDEGAFISQMLSMEMTDTVQQMSNAYGQMSESITYEPDKAFIALQNYGLSVAKFQTNTAFRQQEINIKQGALDLKSAKQQSELGADIGGSGFTTLGKADPTRLEVAKSYETLTGVFENLLTYTVNPFTTRVDGTRETDPKYQSAVNEMWVNNKIPPEAQNNPYVEAYHLGLSEAQRDGKNKEASMRYAHDRVQAIMSSPSNRREVIIFNKNQDLLANKLSLEHVLDDAKLSNDPARYLQDKDMGFAFQYQRNNLDAESWKKNKEIAAAAEIKRNQLASQVMNYIDIGSNNKNFDDDLNYVTRLNSTEIVGSEVHMDGTVDIWFDPEASLGAKGEPGDNNYKPAGSLHNGYYSYVDKDGITQHQRFEGNKMTINIPEYSIMNAHSDLGTYIDHRPQTRYAISKSGIPTSFQVFRENDGTYSYKINGVDLPSADQDGWASSAKTTPSDVIEAVRRTIQTQI